MANIETMRFEINKLIFDSEGKIESVEATMGIPPFPLREVSLSRELLIHSLQNWQTGVYYHGDKIKDISKLEK